MLVTAIAVVVSVMHCFVCDVYCVVSVLWTSGLRASWRGLNVLNSVTSTAAATGTSYMSHSDHVRLYK